MSWEDKITFEEVLALMKDFLEELEHMENAIKQLKKLQSKFLLFFNEYVEKK
jgi:hypothetical protein